MQKLFGNHLKMRRNETNLKLLTRPLRQVINEMAQSWCAKKRRSGKKLIILIMILRKVPLIAMLEYVLKISRIMMEEYKLMIVLECN